MPEGRAVRIGIDVGGTFTKAVLIDNATLEIIARNSTMTTHDDPKGVARGVVEVFLGVLADSGSDPSDVVFIAHSTTQATNALLEGDVAHVGVIGMASRVEALLARSQSTIKEIELAPGRFMRPSHRFLTHDALSAASVREAIEALRTEGATVLVATSAFGVDDRSGEELVMQEAAGAGIAATGGHEISKLYGLTARTRTAVINASILPKMIATADMTEASVRQAGILAPLMIMRGDGGVMNVAEMRRRPVLTILSGPAASVAGALMYLKVSDGIYFEVGGTSTNIGVIRNGRPTVRHARVGGHETYVDSLDVRVAGIAGGSMVRLRGSEIADVGPRSAHIAGLPYAAFADPSAMEEPVLEFLQPRAGDPDDYVAIRCADGRRYALTTTCAANVLGYARPGWHAYGNPGAARAAMQPLADRLGIGVEEAARRILEKAAAKLIPIVEDLIREYALDRDQSVLAGEGGGAAALIPYVAEVSGLAFRISPDAEVISSIGVALAMVRETIERVIPNPSGEDLERIKREACEAAVRLGAVSDDVEVVIEVDALTQRVRAVATGASEMRAQDRSVDVSEAEARTIAAVSMGIPEASVTLAASTDQIRVFQGTVTERKWRFLKSRRLPVRVVDRSGVIRAQRADGTVVRGTAATAVDVLRRTWEDLTIYNGDSVITPQVFVIAGRRIVDLSGVTVLDQAVTIARSELAGQAEEAPVAIVGMQGARGL